MRATGSLAVLAVLVGAPRPSFADKGTAKDAAEALATAKGLMKEKKYAKACEAFEDSQKLDPQTSTQVALAGCYDLLGKLGSAWRIYHLLGDSKKASKLAARAGTITLEFKPHADGVRVFANSSDAASAIEEPMPVDSGDVVLAASAPGFQTWRKTVEVEDGKDTKVLVKLVRNTKIAKIDPNNPDEPDPERAQDDLPEPSGGVRPKPFTQLIRAAVDLGFLFRPQAYRGLVRIAYGYGELFDLGLALGVRGGAGLPDAIASDLATEVGAVVDGRVFLPFGSFCRAYGHLGVGYWTTTGVATVLGGGVACADWRSGSGPQIYVGVDKEIGDGPGGGVMVGIGTTLTGKR